MPSGVEHNMIHIGDRVVLPLIAASMPSGVEHTYTAMPSPRASQRSDRRLDAFGR